MHKVSVNSAVILFKMASKVQTRSAIEHSIFGTPTKMRQTVLPTYLDVMRHALLIKCEQNLPNAFLIKNICKQLIPDLKEIWLRASIPIVSDYRIEQLFRKYYDKYDTTQKYKSSPNLYQAHVEKFLNDSKKLFDIACCKCIDYSTCRCEKERKVPIEEREFIKDQRNSRSMEIGLLDLAKTRKNIRKLERQSLFSTNEDKCPSSEEASSRDSTHNARDRSISFVRDDAKKYKQMCVDLESVAMACDRYGISNRSAATIVTETLKAFNIVSEEDTSNVVDQNKIKRERTKARKSRQEIVPKSIKSLYFDGRKDLTLFNKETDGKYSKSKEFEEHIVLIEEPNSIYLGHLNPKEGTAEIIGNELFNFLEKNCIDIDEGLRVLGCDGAVVNTGIHHGICRRIEEKVDRPLHHFICLLHTNELLLHHLFKKLVGPTSGPKTHTGELAQAIQFKNCDHLEIANFVPIKVKRYCEGTELDSLKLSTDQDLLFRLCKAVATGKIDSDLARRVPGPVSNSRWLTTAIRILRIYVSEKNPSGELKTLSTFIMHVYAKLWFSIKSQWSCVMGSCHLFEMIRLTRYLDKNLRTIVDKVIQNNGYFAHQENILLAMLFDKDCTIRKVACQRIKKIRAEKNFGFRKFEIPEINFEAKAYYDMIGDWNTAGRVEPPLTVGIPIREIELQSEISADNVALPLAIKIAQYPCYTQAVEKAIRCVTEASAKVCGEASRDGFIRTRNESVQRNPSFENKGQYNVN